jgi:hypothetical protein
MLLRTNPEVGLELSNTPCRDGAGRIPEKLASTFGDWEREKGKASGLGTSITTIPVCPNPIVQNTWNGISIPKRMSGRLGTGRNGCEFCIFTVIKAYV